jgi:hypothetical protein
LTNQIQKPINLTEKEQKYLNKILEEQRIGSLTTFKNLVNSVYEEIPVDMDEFISSKDYLNIRTFGNGVDSGIYPKIKDILWEIDKPEIREAYLCMGRGSGKSYFCSILLARSVYRLMCLRNPQQYLGLSSGSPIYTMNLSVNQEQAKKVIFSELLERLNGCKWFWNKYKARVFDVEFPKNIFALSGHSSSRAFLGYNVISGVLDEASHFLDNAYRCVAQELLDAIKGSMLTRFPHDYKLVVISSPLDPGDVMIEWVNSVKKDGKSFELRGSENVIGI